MLKFLECDIYFNLVTLNFSWYDICFEMILKT